MKILTAIAIIITVFTSGCSLETKPKGTRFGNRDTVDTPQREPEKPTAPVSTLANTIDIHYSAQYCTECHVDVPRKGSHPQLRYGGDFKVLCRCHYGDSKNYPHPVDRKPSPEMMTAIPAQFPLREGRITCSTCHDIVVQCRDNQLERTFLKEQKFLRGEPFKTKNSICFRCHNINRYQRYNPHRQLNAKNEIEKETCLYCHSELPDENQTSAKDARLIGDLKTLCIRCHMIEPRQDFHAKHLRTPSAEVLTRIKQLQDHNNIILPLNEDGMITCATCHNPHEKGVIPDVRAGATGAGGDKRQRLEENMCIKCHPMR